MGVIEDRIEALPTPPAPEEGEILKVDFDASTHFRSAPTRPCHQCGDELDITSESYVEAKVRLYEPNPATGSDQTLLIPQFCSRECWGDWASGNDS